MLLEVWGLGQQTWVRRSFAVMKLGLEIEHHAVFCG